jgi:hypothetical protein
MAALGRALRPLVAAFKQPARRFIVLVRLSRRFRRGACVSPESRAVLRAGRRSTRGAGGLLTRDGFETHAFTCYAHRLHNVTGTGNQRIDAHPIKTTAPSVAIEVTGHRPCTCLRRERTKEFAGDWRVGKGSALALRDADSRVLSRNKGDGLIQAADIIEQFQGARDRRPGQHGRAWGSAPELHELEAELRGPLIGVQLFRQVARADERRRVGRHA